MSTVALMLQANPKLTPNGVKAILQYTAQQYAGYDALTEGAGFLNSVGAVRLARFYSHGEACTRSSRPKNLEQTNHLGQPPADRRNAQPLRQRLPREHDLGRRQGG